LRKTIEVPVARVKYKIVLQSQSCNPQVVSWHRSSLFPELAIKGAIVMRRLVVGKQNPNAIPQQKISQHPLVLWLMLPMRKPSPKLA
jgi:hypothetical protein